MLTLDGLSMWLDFQNFMSSVIHKASFDKIVQYIEDTKKDKQAKIIYGGTCRSSARVFAALMTGTR